MAKDMKAQIKITADGKQALSVLGSVTGGLKKIRGSIFNLKNLIAGGLSTLGITRFAKSIVDAGREVEQLEIKIDRLAGAGSGEKIYRELNKIAVETGATANKLAAAAQAVDKATDAVVNRGFKNKQESLGANNIVKPTKPTGSGADTARQLALAQAKAQAEMLKLISEAAVKELNNLLGEGLISVKDYYDKRRFELKKQYDAELANLDEQLRLTKDKVERFNLEQEKTRLTFTFEVDDAALQREALKKETDLAKEKAALLREIELRGLKDTLENQTLIRLEALTAQHEAEIELLREKQATEEEIIQASLNHQLEMEKVKAEESRKVFESQMQTYQTIAGNISAAFEAMYDATGESNKAFLVISRAAAIATAIMNTQVAITKALAEGGPFMGPALAAIAAASGAAAVATIVSQSFNSGGVVQGASPHKRADNIPANLTAGEFVHQVDAVNYYGTDVMQALNHRKIPKAVLQGLMGKISVPSLPARGARFNQGGPVTNTGADKGGKGGRFELTIVNVSGEDAVGEYLMSSAGEMRIVNIISNNKETIKQQLELG